MGDNAIVFKNMHLATRFQWFAFSGPQNAIVVLSNSQNAVFPFYLKTVSSKRPHNVLVTECYLVQGRLKTPKRI